MDRAIFLYLGPSRTFRELLGDYELKGELQSGILKIGDHELSWLGPTDKFKFELDEEMERIIKGMIRPKGVCRECGRTRDAHMGNSGYVMLLPGHEFIS